MDSQINNLISRLTDKQLVEASVISWGSPVPSFGDISTSLLATIGLNPSNLEFVGNDGEELNGAKRRFHTLNSLGISNWSEIEDIHIESISQLCKEYFSRNPYDRWFKKLDYIISGTSYSYYFPSGKACHLDLVPYATMTKWGELSNDQKALLLELVGDTLGLLLYNSPIKVLVLNGRSVIDNFISISDVEFIEEQIQDWTLPRKKTDGVVGISYTGMVSNIGGVKLKQKLKVLGFNHNIQSSFGVTKKVQKAIRNWISNEV